MADLVLPDDVEITSMPIGPDHSGLTPSRGEYTQHVSYLATAPASWRGRVEFGVNDINSEPMGALLSRLLASMRGGQKTLALPMPGPTIPEPVNATTIQAIDTEGHLTLSRDLVIPADAPADYPANYWIRLAQRVYVVESLLAANRIAVEPVAAAAVGDQLHRADVITVRLASPDPGPIPRTPDFWGPLGFDWVEAI